MEQTTELRLAWRQEFATALLDEMEAFSPELSNDWCIKDFCNRHIILVGHNFDMRNLEFSVMGYLVKRKLKYKGVCTVIAYLTMIEDVFTDCKVSLN